MSTLVFDFTCRLGYVAHSVRDTSLQTIDEKLHQIIIQSLTLVETVIVVQRTTGKLLLKQITYLLESCFPPRGSDVCLTMKGFLYLLKGSFGRDRRRYWEPTTVRVCRVRTRWCGHKFKRDEIWKEIRYWRFLLKGLCWSIFKLIRAALARVLPTFALKKQRRD